MTLAEFLGKGSDQPSAEQQSKQKQSSVYRKEIAGTRDERITLINDYGRTLRPQGRVIGLLNSPNRDQKMIATLVELEQSTKKGDTEQVLFAMPVDQKLPWQIVDSTPKEFTQDKLKDRNPAHRYYMVQFKEWLTTQKRAHCKILECIGEAGNLEAESLRILKENDICTEAYDIEGQETVHESLKVFAKDIDPETGEWQIPESEISQRVDLRQKRVFTIDPVTARDLDDALSIDKVSDTVYEIGVHIADVSYFVRQGSDLDREALKRSTSTYFVHKVWPMLPRMLCERLCSLNPNVDRLTYSIFFRMDLATGQLDKSRPPRIHRSVINSCAKWSYDLVQ